MRRNSIKCLRCNVPMRLKMEEKLQLGKAGWIMGDIPHLFAGALDVAIYSCPVCGKLEFFDRSEDTIEMPRKICPECGAEYGVDSDCCPVCGYAYTK